MLHYRPETDTLGRMPPIDLDAEMCVLGSILLLPACLDDVSLILQAEDFHDDANRIAQDQLVHELRVDQISSIRNAKRYQSKRFLPQYNDCQQQSCHFQFFNHSCNLDTC